MCYLEGGEGHAAVQCGDFAPVSAAPSVERGGGREGEREGEGSVLLVQ